MQAYFVNHGAITNEGRNHNNAQFLFSTSKQRGAPAEDPDLAAKWLASNEEHVIHEVGVDPVDLHVLSEALVGIVATSEGIVMIASCPIASPIRIPRRRMNANRLRTPSEQKAVVKNLSRNVSRARWRVRSRNLPLSVPHS